MNDDNRPTDDLQQRKQIRLEDTSTLESNYNYNYQLELEQPVQEKKKRLNKYEILALVLLILLILLVVGDIINIVHFKMYFNALLLGDNIGIVAMLILYSIFFILKKKRNV